MQGMGFTDFSKLAPEGDVAATATEVKATEEAKKEEKKKSNSELNAYYSAELTKTIQEDPDFEQKICTLSKSVQINYTLGYGDEGNIIADSKAPEGTARKDVLKKTSYIVGYELQNIGNEPISYQTETYAQNDSGEWVGTQVTLTAKPGEKFNLTRKYMTLFGIRPEVSFTFANGKMKKSSANTSKMSIDKVLESYYFSFDDPTIRVNSDEVKLAVADKVGEKQWIVKTEYEAVFGYLNNAPASKARRTSGGKESVFTKPVCVANALRRALQEQGKM
jgi:hypothetical protein